MSVIHIKDAPAGWQDDPDYIYIGRSGKGLVGHFGNPFKLLSEDHRAEVLKSYFYWLIERIHKSGPDSQYAPWKLAKLAKKTLVCFCAPKPCHGDILFNVACVLSQYE